jgi:hypothetical protein
VYAFLTALARVRPARTLTEASAAAAGAAERALRDGSHPRPALAPVDASIAADIADARAGGGGAEDTRQSGPRSALAVAEPAFACFGTSDPADAVSDARAYTSRRLAAVLTAKEHPAQARLADALYALLVDLHEYVKATFPAGVRHSAGPQAQHHKQAQCPRSPLSLLRPIGGSRDCLRSYV